jgi:hypothetical protein
VRGEDPDSEPRRVRPGGSGNGSVDPRNWWFAAYHSYFIHHTKSGRTAPLVLMPDQWRHRSGTRRFSEQ